MFEESVREQEEAHKAPGVYCTGASDAEAWAGGAGREGRARPGSIYSAGEANGTCWQVPSAD